MTKEALEERLQLLQKELEQVRANLFAYDGAIQECKYWLSLVEEKNE